MCLIIGVIPGRPKGEPGISRFRARCFASPRNDGYPSHRHDDLAEMLVGLHVLECAVDVVERKHLVDRQLQLAGLDCAPDVFPDLLEDLADLLDGAGAEGDADIVDAAGGMEVEIEVAMGAAEPADIDDA